MRQKSTNDGDRVRGHCYLLSFSKDAEESSELCDTVFDLAYCCGIPRQFDIVICYSIAPVHVKIGRCAGNGIRGKHHRQRSMQREDLNDISGSRVNLERLRNRLVRFSTVRLNSLSADM